MKCIKMALNQASVLLYMCICLVTIQQSSCTTMCNIQPKQPIIGEIIEFNCWTIEAASAETKLIIRRPSPQKSLPVERRVGENGELTASYTWIATSDDVEFEVKCKEKFGENVTDTCAKTIPTPISKPVSVPTMETTTISDPYVSIKPQLNGNGTRETQLLRPTTSQNPVTNATSDWWSNDIVTVTNELNTADYFTTVTYEDDWNVILTDNDFSLFEQYPTIFWSLVVGLVIVFFVVIIATMCLVFLTQSKRRKEREHPSVPYTGSMEVLTGPFRRPAGAYLDLNESQAAAPNTVDRACQTMPCDRPWMAIDVNEGYPPGYEPNGDIPVVARPASVAGCGLEFEPNVLGPRGISYIQTKHGLARSESDRRYSAVCRTRTAHDPQFYIPQQPSYRHSDHEMYHLQKYNHPVYDAQPIATEFEPMRRYKRRTNQIAGTRQPRPYSYIDPSIAQLVPPSASGKGKAGNRDEYSDSTL